MVGMVFFIIFAIVVIGLGGFIIKKTLDAQKSPIKVDYVKLIKQQLILSGIFALAFLGMFMFVYLWAEINPLPFEVVQTIIGSLVSGFSLIAGINAFILHYYDNKIPENIDKNLNIAYKLSVALFIIFGFILTNGFANYWVYPLVNGINFDTGFSRPGIYGPKPNIAFYALCILGGALFVFALSDHKLYQEYGEHGTIDSTFLVAFPAGIIGARIFYVIGNWEIEFANTPNPILAAISIQNGGLTILGGAIVGIVAGVAWYMWRNKGKSIWIAVDLLVPTILIAQGIGRWGNFFNCEVHGVLVDESYWSWLPTMIFNNIHYSSVHSTVATGQVYNPLFLIECISNITGYFVIAYIFGKLLRKHTELGDLAFGYIIWYGLTRVLMEPLRDTIFNMGSDGYWSWVWSMVFVVAGCALIVANHVIRYFIKKHKDEYIVKDNAIKNSIIESGIIVFVSACLIIVGSVLMGTNMNNLTIAYSPYNIGLIILILGISCFITLAISLIPIFDKYVLKGKEK